MVTSALAKISRVRASIPDLDALNSASRSRLAAIKRPIKPTMPAPLANQLPKKGPTIAAASERIANTVRNHFITINASLPEMSAGGAPVGVLHPLIGYCVARLDSQWRDGDSHCEP